MKKSWILLVLLALSAFVLSSCTSNASALPSPSPSVIPMASPVPTTAAPALPSASPAIGAGITTLEDAKRVSSAIKTDVVKLSELTNADVVAAGNTALIGIQYDTQYQGGLTDRLKTMVTERVEAAEKTLTTVHVTDDTKLVQEIQRLATQMEKSEISFAELQTRVLEISAQISGEGAGITQPSATTGA